MAYTPSSPDNVRLTITVTPDVHAAFKRLATASGMSIGRAMGEWLGDTLEAVEFTAKKVEEARSAPKLVMREMHAYAQGLVDETGALMEKMRDEGRRARVAASAAPATAEPHPPRLVIRGGKSPGKTLTKPPPHGWTSKEEAEFQAKSMAVLKREQAAKAAARKGS